MPITNSKFFKYAFAAFGNRQDIPDEPPADQSVNIRNGYDSKYSQNPEADGLFILREQFNELHYMLSNGVRDFQINGTRLWDQNVVNAGGYPAGARVSVYFDLGTNRLSLTPTKFTHNAKDFYMATTIQLVSLIDENKDDPTSDNNIFKTWWIDDGVDVFQCKFSFVTAKDSYFPIPPSYIDVGGNNPSTKYNFEDYPRVKFFKSKNALPDYIIDNSDGTFSIKDLRGGFPRVWSNGREGIDPLRQFGDWQQDAIRDFNITTGGANQQYFLGNFNRGGNVSGEFSPGGGNYIYGKVSLSESAVPTTSGEGAENRPYNFNVRAYMKL